MENVRIAHPLTALLTAMITCIGVFWSTSVPAQTADADRAAFRKVITSQIEAFRRDDAAAAYAYAAPSIKGIFGTPDRFIEMVRRTYGPVYRPREFSFGPVTIKSGRPTQQVNIIGPDGGSWIAEYTMQRLDDGSWRIAGVVLIKPKGENA